MFNLMEFNTEEMECRNESILKQILEKIKILVCEVFNLMEFNNLLLFSEQEITTPKGATVQRSGRRRPGRCR